MTRSAASAQCSDDTRHLNRDLNDVEAVINGEGLFGYARKMLATDWRATARHIQETRRGRKGTVAATASPSFGRLEPPALHQAATFGLYLSKCDRLPRRPSCSPVRTYRREVPTPYCGAQFDGAYRRVDRGRRRET